MSKKAYYIILEEQVILSKKKYLDWRGIQDELRNYKASIGPWSMEELIEYFKSDFKSEFFWPFCLDRINDYYNSKELVLFEMGDFTSKEDCLKIISSPWYSNDETISLKEELLLEIHEEHLLYGKNIEIVARRYDQDDVLAFLPDDQIAAIVHLTWSKKKEKDKWPLSQMFYNQRGLLIEINKHKVEFEN